MLLLEGYSAKTFNKSSL